MKILLLTGDSGVGKSSIAALLCQDERFNFIKSYTTRPRRLDDFDHTFVSEDEMKDLLINNSCIASTKINSYYYCAFREQFNPEKINVYIVDVDGINDTIEAFPKAQFMTILITRKNVDIDQTRKNRRVSVPSRDQVDFTIENDSDTIESAVGVIHFLTLKDDGVFFRQAHQKFLNIRQKIKEHENAVEYHLKEIGKLKQELLKCT